MSGVETLAVVGLASNVVQFVDFATKVCGRIKEYYSAVALPAKFAAQADRLSGLLTILRSLDRESGSGSLDGPSLQKCQSLAAKLSSQRDHLSVDGGRGFQILKKAFKSLRREAQLQEMQLALDGLVETLKLQLQIDARSVSRVVQSNTESIVHCQYEHSAQLAALQRMTVLSPRDNAIVATPTQPIWMVPIGRNPDFVGRESILTDLSSRLLARPDIVRSAALCGLGGMGKSQIALEYACRLREYLVDISVFWVHAGNTAQFIESYQRIAHECQVPVRDQAKADFLQLVKNWFETRCQYQWLMVVDNVDDHAMFFDTLTSHGKTLRQYIPQTPRGSILYTTRSRDIGIDLLLDRDPIYVSHMDVDEARALLGERVRSESTTSEQHQLLNELLFLPLAISQAVAFMVRRKKSISEYLEMYRGSESARLKLLGQRATQHGRDNKSSDSVLTTWWLSFEYIKRENAMAANLLTFMSFVARQSIPVSLLTGGEDKFDFDEAIGLLESYSLITSDATRSAYNVHRLVGIAVQRWLMECEHRYDAFAERALQIVASKCPSNPKSFEAWATCSTYFPHVEAVLRASATSDSVASITARAYLHSLLSIYLYTNGAYKDSEIRARESVRLSELVYGRQHPTTLDRIAYYTLTISGSGHNEEVTNSFREVFESRRKTQGYRNLETLYSLGDLGDALRYQGDYKEAREIFQRRLCETLKLLERDPENVALEKAVIHAQFAIAVLYSDLGRWKLAEQTYRQIMDKAKTPCEKNATLRGLGNVFLNQGRYHEAKPLYSDLLKFCVEVLGEQHPWKLDSLKALVVIASGEGKHDEAEKRLRHVYDTNRATRGDDDLMTIQSMGNLASSIAKQGRYCEAEALAKRCLGAMESFFGLRHPGTLDMRYQVGHIMRCRGNYNDAHRMFVESLTIAENLEEVSECLQVDLLDGIVGGLEAQKKWKEAECFRRQELKILAISADTDEAKRQRRFIGLANFVSRQGRWEEAVQILEEVLDATMGVPGWDDKDTLVLQRMIAKEYLQHDMFEIAEEYLQKTVNLQLGLPRSGNGMFMDDLGWLAHAQSRQGRYAESERNFRQELAISTETLGPEDRWTLNTVADVAHVLIQQDASSEEAALLLRGVYPVLERICGVDDEDTQDTLFWMVTVLTNMGHMEEAEVYRRRILNTTGTDQASEDHGAIHEKNDDESHISL